jgi:hypothetical protein
MKPSRAFAVLALPALLAACSSVNIGVGLPIGRAGGIFIGGSVPIPASPAASAASAPSAAASSPKQ